MEVLDPALGRSRWFFDLVCGYGAFNFGHAPRAILRVLARELAFLDGSAALPNRPAEALAARLVHSCGFAKGMAYFTAGGSQAIEIALRIGRILSGRPKVAGMTSGFHGYGAETIQLSSDFVPGEHLSGLAASRDVLVIPWNDERAFAALRAGAKTCGTVVIEPILGAAGFRSPDRRWFRRLLEEAREMGMFTILDEIQVGMGRTGRLLACENLLSQPERRTLVDAVALSKSLAGGVWPLSAIVLNGARHRDLMRLNETASLGETFSNNPAACAAAAMALDMLESNDGELLARVRLDGAWLHERLSAHVRAERLQGVEVRGSGLALVLDFPDKDAARRFVRHAWDASVLCYVSGGARYACVKLIPPLTITRAERTAIDRALARALHAYAVEGD